MALTWSSGRTWEKWGGLLMSTVIFRGTENVVKLSMRLSHNSGEMKSYTELHAFSASVVWCVCNILMKLSNKKWDTSSKHVAGACPLWDLLWGDLPELGVLGASQIRFCLPECVSFPRRDCLGSPAWRTKAGFVGRPHLIPCSFLNCAGALQSKGSVLPAPETKSLKKWS